MGSAGNDGLRSVIDCFAVGFGFIGAVKAIDGRVPFTAVVGKFYRVGRLLDGGWVGCHRILFEKTERNLVLGFGFPRFFLRKEKTMGGNRGLAVNGGFQFFIESGWFGKEGYGDEDDD